MGRRVSQVENNDPFQSVAAAAAAERKAVRLIH